NTITSGGLLVTSNVGPGSGSVTITGGTLQPPAGTDLVVHQFSTANALTISSAPGGPGAVQARPGLRTPDKAPNTFTRACYLTARTLVASVAATLGPTAGTTPTIQFNGGTVRFTASSSTGSTIQPWVFGPAGGTVEVTGGTTTKQGNSISGSGPLTKTGTGILSIGSNASTFSGLVFVNAGTVTFTSNQFQGAGSMTVAS